jgi:hypothetical protein
VILTNVILSRVDYNTYLIMKLIIAKIAISLKMALL